MGLKFETPILDSFLWIGIILEILRIDGKHPDEKELLQILEIGVEIALLMSLTISFGILFGPVLLFVSNLDIISSISLDVVGLIKNEFMN